jgi:hypothetical protein
MATKNEYIRIMTPPFRVSFPNLTEARPGPDGTGKPKFGLKMLFPKNMTGSDLEQMKKIRAICAQVAAAKWPDGLPKGLKKPLHDGDTDSEYPEDGGFWYASARSTQKPGVVNQKNIEIQDNAAIEKLLYAGCWARATIAIGATETGSKCVHFILGNIQKIRDDESFSSRKSAQEEFDALEPSEAQSDFDEKETSEDEF